MILNKHRALSPKRGRLTMTNEEKKLELAIETIDVINERLKQNFTDAQLRVRIRTILEGYYEKLEKLDED